MITLHEVLRHVAGKIGVYGNVDAEFRGDTMVELAGGGAFVAERRPAEGYIRLTPAVRTREDGARLLDRLGDRLTAAGFDVEPAASELRVRGRLGEE